VFVHNSCDLVLADGFRLVAEKKGWILTLTQVYFPDMGDSVADSGALFAGNHGGATPSREPVRVVPPPASHPDPLASFVYAPFNNREHALCPSWRHESFASSGFRMSEPEEVATPLKPYRARHVCSVYRTGDDINTSAGVGVYNLTGICPPLCPSNSNAFGSTFGIEFEAADRGTPAAFVRLFSAFEVVSCFKLDRNLTHALSHASNFGLLECGVPSATSGVFLKAILRCLELIRTESFEIMEPH